MAADVEPIDDDLEPEDPIDIQLEAEYQAAPMDRLLGDAEYEQTRDLPREQFLQMSEADRRVFYSTHKWHANERFRIPSLDGIVVGNRSAEEVLADVDADD